MERWWKSCVMFGLPCHYIVCNWRGRDAGWWIGLHALEVAHQTPSRCGRHVARYVVCRLGCRIRVVVEVKVDPV